MKVHAINHRRVLRFGITIYFLCIAVYNPELYGFNLSNFILLGITVIAVMQIKLKIHVKRGIFFSLALLYSIFLISAVQMGTIDGLTRFIKLLLPLCTMLICSKIMKDESSRLEMVNVLALTNISACLTGIIRFYVLHDYGYAMQYLGARIGRMRGSFLQPNVFATFLVMTMPFCVHAIWNDIREGKKSTIWRLLLIATIVVNLFCVYMARSRWSMVAMAAYVVIYPFVFLRNKSRRSKVAGLLVSVIVAGGVLLLLYSNTTVVSFFAHRGSNEIRSDSLQHAFELARDNHFIGMGLGHGIGSVLDSTIMNLLIDTGLLGLVLFTGLCLSCMIELIKRKEEIGDISIPFLIMFVGFCIEMVAESVLYNSLINCFVGIIWYLSLSNRSNGNVTRKNIA